jgi:hypothetical protein
MTSGPVTAAGAGTWKLGDLTVNRMGVNRPGLTASPGRVRGSWICRVNEDFTNS